MELSIIIVNWQSTEYLRGCLRSVYAETRDISFEVIVVDNGSAEACEPVLRNEFPLVRFVRSETNLGFGGANNLAACYATGSTLLFLNPDTKILGNALQGMAVSLTVEPTAAAVGASLLNENGSVQTSCVQAFPTITNQVLDSELLRRAFPGWSGWGTKALREPQGLVDVDAISGACFMVNKKVFDEVGGFDTQYFMYSDDIDLSYRIRRAGHRVRYNGNCKVIHYGGTSSAKQADYFEDIMQRHSMAQFFSKRRGQLYAAAYRVGTGVSASLRIGLILCNVVLGREEKRSRRLQKWLQILNWAVGMDGITNNRRADKTA